MTQSLQTNRRRSSCPIRGSPSRRSQAKLGIPMGTVKARMARGMRRLAAIMDGGEHRVSDDTAGDMTMST